MEWLGLLLVVLGWVLCFVRPWFGRFVNGNEPVVLQPVSKDGTTTSGAGNRCMTVTREQPVSGKGKLPG